MKKGVQKRQNSDEEGRTEPEPHLLEISLRESAHGFESHPLRHLRGWKQHSSPVFSRKALPDVIESYRQTGIWREAALLFIVMTIIFLK